MFIRKLWRYLLNRVSNRIESVRTYSSKHFPGSKLKLLNYNWKINILIYMLVGRSGKEKRYLQLRKD